MRNRNERRSGSFVLVMTDPKTSVRMTAGPESLEIEEHAMSVRVLQETAFRTQLSNVESELHRRHIRFCSRLRSNHAVISTHCKTLNISYSPSPTRSHIIRRALSSRSPPSRGLIRIRLEKIIHARSDIRPPTILSIDTRCCSPSPLLLLLPRPGPRVVRRLVRIRCPETVTNAFKPRRRVLLKPP